MNKFFKCTIFSSALLSSAAALAVPVFTITPSVAALTVKPGSTSIETFTVKNNMAASLKVTNIKAVSSISALQINVTSDGCTGQTLMHNGECTVTTNLISTNTNKVVSGQFDLHACIDSGAQCSGIAIKPTITIDPTAPQPLIAGGNYVDNASAFNPMLAISSDGGNTWSYKVEHELNLPADYARSGTFYSVNCSGAACIAGGNYVDNTNTWQPMLAISSDGGNTWSYKVEQARNLPDNHAEQGVFNSVNCSGAACIAGGEYYDNTGTQQLMLAISSDGGNTWSYKVEQALNLPANYAERGRFYSANCSGAACIAGGNYKDNAGKQQPMLAISSDGGNTWSYKVDKGLNLPTDYANDGNFQSVNCSGAACLAGGHYASDGGNTWSYKVEQALNLPSNYARRGIFYSANCSGAACIAGGNY